jgi:hypothetical protein
MTIFMFRCKIENSLEPVLVIVEYVSNELEFISWFFHLPHATSEWPVLRYSAGNGREICGFTYSKDIIYQLENTKLQVNIKHEHHSCLLIIFGASITNSNTDQQIWTRIVIKIR